MFSTLVSEEITRRRGYLGEGCPGYMLSWRDRDCVGIRVKSNVPTFNCEIVLTANFPDLQYCTKHVASSQLVYTSTKVLYSISHYRIEEQCACKHQHPVAIRVFPFEKISTQESECLVNYIRLLMSEEITRRRGYWERSVHWLCFRLEGQGLCWD